MTPLEIALLVISLLLLLVSLFLGRDVEIWQDKYFEKPTHYLDSIFELNKKVEMVDIFYSIHRNKIGKFKTCGLYLEFGEEEKWFISHIEGKCIEGPENLIGKIVEFDIEEVGFTKEELIKHL